MNLFIYTILPASILLPAPKQIPWLRHYEYISGVSYVLFDLIPSLNVLINQEDFNISRCN